MRKQRRGNLSRSPKPARSWGLSLGCLPFSGRVAVGIAMDVPPAPPRRRPFPGLELRGTICEMGKQRRVGLTTPPAPGAESRAVPGSALNTSQVFMSRSFLLVAAVGLGEDPGSAASWQLGFWATDYLSEFRCLELESGCKHGTYCVFDVVVKRMR